MKRRLRKKKRLGEFRELGFEIRADLRDGIEDADFEAFMDRWIGVVDARQLAFGGGAGCASDARARGGSGRRARCACPCSPWELGRIPTADEVVAQHLVRAAAAHAEAWRWGLYRNARFNLAESCARRGLREDALRLFLEVSLLDLNGPRNCGTKDPEITRRFPPFDPKTAFLAPGVISRTADVIAELKLSPDDTRNVFESVASTVGPALKLPRSTDAAWRELAKALREQT
jgi:hypothetical protein